MVTAVAKENINPVCFVYEPHWYSLVYKGTNFVVQILVKRIEIHILLVNDRPPKNGDHDVN